MSKRVKYLPTKDIVFKKMFGEFGNEDITKNFINSITSSRLNKVTIDHKLDLPIESFGQKRMVADLVVKDSMGRRYILEMQRRNETGLLKRFFGYICKAYVSEIKVKEEYDKLKKVTLILIMEQPLPELATNEDYNTIIELAVKSKIDLDFKYIVEIHVIELSKYKKYRRSGGKIKPWIELFVNPYGKEMEEMARTKEELRAAVDLLKKLNEDEEVRRIAEFEEFNEFLIKDEEYHMKKRVRKEGLAEGRAEGRVEGMKETTIKIAKKMIKNKMKMDDIIKCTGLSEKEIKELKGIA